MSLNELSQFPSRPLFCFSPSLEEAASNESVLKVLGGMVMSCYAKYWIYVCGGMFIMVSFAGKLVGYKIVYMLLFLMCLCLYQVASEHYCTFKRNTPVKVLVPLLYSSSSERVQVIKYT